MCYKVEFVRLAQAMDDIVSLDKKSTLDLVRVRPGHLNPNPNPNPSP